MFSLFIGELWSFHAFQFDKHNFRVACMQIYVLISYRLWMKWVTNANILYMGNQIYQLKCMQMLGILLLINCSSKFEPQTIASWRTIALSLTQLFKLSQSTQVRIKVLHWRFCIKGVSSLLAIANRQKTTNCCINPNPSSALVNQSHLFFAHKGVRFSILF